MTLPMDQIWYAIYLTTLVYVVILIPFTMFWYESDFDAKIGEKIWNAVLTGAII